MVFLSQVNCFSRCVDNHTHHSKQKNNHKIINLRGFDPDKNVIKAAQTISFLLFTIFSVSSPLAHSRAKRYIKS